MGCCRVVIRPYAARGCSRIGPQAPVRDGGDDAAGLLDTQKLIPRRVGDRVGQLLHRPGPTGRIRDIAT